MTAEYPIFVPFGPDRIAAVVTVPEAPPRGFVLFLQGLGAPRHHRYSLWSRMARTLADMDIASARLDWPEVGDSTGSIPATLSVLPWREAKAVVDTALDELGLGSFVIVGNCLGMHTGLHLAFEDRRCVGMASLVGGPGMLLDPMRDVGRWTVDGPMKPNGASAPKAPAHQGKPSRFVRLTRKVKRRLMRRSDRIAWLPDLKHAVASFPNLLIFQGREELAPRFPRQVDALTASVRRTNGSTATDVTVQNFVGPGTREFRFSVPMQADLIDALVEWVDRVVPGERSHETGGRAHADSHAE